MPNPEPELIEALCKLDTLHMLAPIERRKWRVELRPEIPERCAQIFQKWRDRGR